MDSPLVRPENRSRAGGRAERAPEWADAGCYRNEAYAAELPLLPPPAAVASPRMAATLRGPGSWWRGAQSAPRAERLGSPVFLAWRG